MYWGMPGTHVARIVMTCLRVERGDIAQSVLESRG
jgi:hypothetical protein